MSAVRVSVVKVEGSAPREAGAAMVVTARGFHGTIGGGALEWRALAQAQALLGKPPRTVETAYALGPELGQCCGGRVTLRFEVTGLEAVKTHANNYRPLLLFGAGHVGRALVLALAPLPFEVWWIDGRGGAFPPVAPGNVKLIQSENPVRELSAAAAGSFVLIMTHSHALDLDIVDGALRDGRFPYVGLIGSATKRARFLRQLRDGGFPQNRADELVCPIGAGPVRSKLPAAIAAATAVELLARDEVLKTAALPIADAPVSARRLGGRGP